MLPPLTSRRRAFVEITKSEHHHGGPGWEFGTCLWSPSANSAGADRYSIMREPAKNDIVLHFYHDTWPDGRSESRLCGRSFVRRPYREVSSSPPQPGPWAHMPPYYRIDLTGFRLFPHPLPLTLLIEKYTDAILTDRHQAAPRFYPFAPRGDHLRTVQGIYLAEATPVLYALFGQALGLHEAASHDPNAQPQPHDTYAEGRRLLRETLSFARNPRLVADAKRHYGHSCQACRFTFSNTYGELGEGYIECHHLNPLAERPDTTPESYHATLDDVTVLCANCHRMVHRRRPALTLDELQQALSQPRP